MNDFVTAFIAYPAPIHTGPHGHDTNVTWTARPLKILGGSVRLATGPTLSTTEGARSLAARAPVTAKGAET
ncbi:hypothetical protein [Komagataeibacter kakiaceti]|uniref:hypothetical protein n=1 Tax=Komagataeibacter kakiaceti TaxID=943261 RepID=UPI001A7E7134|nr:hypothetical protein [Komagataeibacter kakiaceti]